jgi:predicted Holliday junction resolvase-like endonuclease
VFKKKCNTTTCIFVRCEKALQLNSRLREQLDESHSTNDALTADLQKLTADWEQMRDEMIAKEEEWKEEEHVSVETRIRALHLLLESI